MKFSVNIRWGWVWPVPIGQKRSPPILVVYPNKSETLIQQFIHIVYHLRSTFLPCLGRLQGWAGYFSGWWVPAIPGPIWYQQKILYRTPVVPIVHPDSANDTGKIFKLDLKWVFYGKKVEFLASNIIIWTKFLIATPLGPIGLGWPTQIEGGQISWLLPSELPFLIFFWVFLAWMPWNISTSNGWKPGSHCSQKKSKNATLNFLDFFFSFFSFFFKRPKKEKKWSFRHQTKVSYALNIINFWFLMKNSYPKNLVPHTFKSA